MTILYYKDKDLEESCGPPVNISGNVSLQSIFVGRGKLLAVVIGEVDSDGTFQLFNQGGGEITKPWTTAYGGRWHHPPIDLEDGLKITTENFTGELSIFYKVYS
ncbi:MAG: hypothetical protein ACOYWZ_20255 [Bacillota bacterium]